MGSGKSFLGRKLALKLGINFLDLDDYISNQSGQTITEIFETKGESTFRMIESIALKQTFRLNNVIIATGGGTPCYKNNIEKMRQNGLVIFIDPTVDILENRLKHEIKTRPLLKGHANLRNFIIMKLVDRVKFYKKANLIYKVTKEGDEGEDLAEFLKGFMERNG